jgi:hypothetical protein
VNLGKCKSIEVAISLCLSTVSRWFQAKEFFTYTLHAKGSRPIHSPFVFDFVRTVLRDQRNFYCYDEIENLRSQLLQRNELMAVTDFGAGPLAGTGPLRTIASMAKQSATPAHVAQLLFRTALHYDCRNMLELGTSLGLTSLYLSSADRQAKVVTIEGDPAVSALAKNHFESLKRKNVTAMTGEFTACLPKALHALKHVDFAYLDGNHRRDATIRYFKAILEYAHDKSILIIGDIHWSKEMKQAWKEICSLAPVTVTIDLYFAGIVFLRKELSKQHFVIRW